MMKIVFAHRMIREEVEVMEKRPVVRILEKRLPRSGIFSPIGPDEPVVHTWPFII
jgi:hypothetical protein